MESAKLAAERSEVVASLTLWAPGAVLAFEIAEKGIIQGKSIKEVEKTGYFDFKGQKLGLNFIEEAKHFQPYDGLESYKNPAFIHQGEMDDVVAMKYAERYKQCWEQNAKLYTYPYADHGWNNLEARETLIDRTVFRFIFLISLKFHYELHLNKKHPFGCFFIFNLYSLLIF